MALKIIRNDITKMQVDAILYTANKKPIYSAGVDSAIYKAAGEDKLLKKDKDGKFAFDPLAIDSSMVMIARVTR